MPIKLSIFVNLLNAMELARRKQQISILIYRELPLQRVKMNGERIPIDLSAFSNGASG